MSVVAATRRRGSALRRSASRSVITWASTPRVPIPAAPFYGAKMVEIRDLNKVFEFINETALFKGQWQYKQGRKSKEEYAEILETEVYPKFKDLKAQAIRDGLAAIDAEFGVFSEIRGRGLMIGAQLRDVHAGKAGEILDRCVEHGLLTLQAGPDVLRFVPALNIGDVDIAEGLSRLRAAIAGFVKG